MAALPVQASEVDRDAGTDTDEALALRSADDPAAFAELYRRYLTPVYRFCLHRAGSVEAAEDATSQVFLRALGGIATYAPGLGGFRPWLFAIAHRTVVDGYRRARPTAPLGEAVDVPDHGWADTPEVAAERADAVAEVRRLLARLPDHQRAVVELRLAGLTGPEIAAALGRSLPSVKLAQHRAYARLRDLLADRKEPTP